MTTDQLTLFTPDGLFELIDWYRPDKEPWQRKLWLGMLAGHRTSRPNRSQGSKESHLAFCTCGWVGSAYPLPEIGDPLVDHVAGFIEDVGQMWAVFRPAGVTDNSQLESFLAVPPELEAEFGQGWTFTPRSEFEQWV